MQDVANLEVTAILMSGPISPDVRAASAERGVLSIIGPRTDAAGSATRTSFMVLAQEANPDLGVRGCRHTVSGSVSECLPEGVT